MDATRSTSRPDSRAGAAAARPHHLAIIAGIAGNERNVFYRRERTEDPARDKLVETGRSEVVPARRSPCWATMCTPSS